MTTSGRPTTLMSYLRQHARRITREEVAQAAGISVATLSRPLRDGLVADEVIRAARHVGASPTDALVSLGLLERADVLSVATTPALNTVSESDLLKELLQRARDRAEPGQS